MIYLESPSTDPYFNLALEQYIFDCLPRSKDYFMLWQNDNAVIVGKHQNTVAELNPDYIRAHGVKVVRRLSGGGAVYHDLGNLNFTYIVDAAKNGPVDLRFFCNGVALALRRLGVDAQVNGRNDITVDGMKFSGNAQYIKEGRLMHHGTILFDSDLSVLSRVLRVSEDKLSSKGVASVRSRVTNLKPFLKSKTDLATFQALLLSALFEGGVAERRPLSPDDLAAVNALRESRYATWEWNYGASPAHTTFKRCRIEGCGTVEVFLSVSHGRISTLVFRGDWFNTDEPDTLISALMGKPLEESSLLRALAPLDVSRYFTGLSAEELVRLLTQ